MKARRLRQHQTGSCNILLRLPHNHQQPLHSKTITALNQTLPPPNPNSLGCQPGTLLLPSSSFSQQPSSSLAPPSLTTTTPNPQANHQPTTSSHRIKEIKRCLQKRNSHRKKLCKVFEKWDKEVKGEIQPEGVREMLGEMGMHVTVEEAGDFVREVEAGGQVLKLSGFLKVVEEPKRISYFSDKSGIPLQLLQTKQLQECGGYQSRISQLSQPSAHPLTSKLPSKLLLPNNTLRSSLLLKYRLSTDSSERFRKNANNLTSYEVEKYGTIAEGLKSMVRKNWKDRGQFEGRLREEGRQGVVGVKELREVMRAVGGVREEEIDAFMCLFQASPYGGVRIQDIGYCVYEQNPQNIHQRLNVKRSGPAPSTVQRGSLIQPSPTKSISESLKTIEKALYTGSIPNFTLFRKLDKDNDGYVSKEDLARHLESVGVGKEEAASVFEKLNENAREVDAVTYSEFSRVFRPGMGVESQSGMYPVLRPIRIQDPADQIKQIRNSICTDFDPRSTSPHQQYKTRFSSTPQFNPLPSYPSPWGLSGDLNQKVQFQRLQKSKLKQIREARQEIIRSNQQKQNQRKQQQQHQLERRKQVRLKSRGLQAWAYEHACQLNNEWR